MTQSNLRTFGAVLALLLGPALFGQGPKGFRPEKLPAAWPVDATVQAAPAKAGGGSAVELAKLFADPQATLVKAARVFLPGKKGKAPRLADGRNAWVALRDGKIVGFYPEPKRRIEVRPEARVLDFLTDEPHSFVMPGICDADSRWFRSAADLADRGASAAVGAAGDLETWQRGWRDLVRASGVTTVFVPASTKSQASGEGVLLSLDLASGVRTEYGHGALYFRLADLTTQGTNLTRKSVAKALRTALEGAKKYDEAKKKWKKDLAEYRKKRKDFLAYYHEHPLKPGEKVKRAAPTRTPRRGGRRGRMPRTKEELEKWLERFPPAMRDRMRKMWEQRMKQRRAAAAKAKPDAKKKAAPKPGAAKAPPRPAYPKRYAKDPAKEALLQVLAGKRALRVEAHRAAEIRELLAVAKDFDLGRLVLVGATEAWKVARGLRLANVAVVLAPLPLPAKGFATLEEHWASSAAKLAAAGVRVAFGSAGTDRGRWLSLLAARAVARGMPEVQALQGLTENGLLAAGARKADSGVVVFSDDPLSPAARVLCVVKNRNVTMSGDGK